MVEDELPTAGQSMDYQPVERRGGLGKIVAIIVIVLVVLGIIGYVVGRYTSVNLPWVKKSVAASEWQAVFLTNGQVYFGKIAKNNGKQIILRDIYYLQVVEKPLQRTQEGEAAASGTQQELTLIKLGNELHGPVDEMVINPDQVLLTEKLKSDSRVVQAINNYLEQQSKK
ncbi:MAG: hypothetical protein AAB791_03085 [Patescibacteria group bacterium]